MKNKIISGRRFIRLIPYFTALTVLFFLLQCSEPELPGEVVKNFYSTYLTTTASGLPGEKDLQILKP